MATTTLSASNRFSPAVTTNPARSWSVPRNPVHFDAGPDRQVEPRRVGLQVVGHLVLGGEGVDRAGEGHSVQSVVTGGVNRRSESHRFRQESPIRVVGVQDHEGQTTPSQMMARPRVPPGRRRRQRSRHALARARRSSVPPASSWRLEGLPGMVARCSSTLPAGKDATNGRRCGKSGVLPT